MQPRMAARYSGILDANLARIVIAQSHGPLIGQWLYVLPVTVDDDELEQWSCHALHPKRFAPP
jgi:hypothetical protein